MSDALSGTMLPDDNHDRPLVGAALHRDALFRGHVWCRRVTACITLPTAPVSEACSAMQMRTTWTRAFPLLMKQLELMLTSGELNPRHQHTVTLYAKGLTCKADTLGSGGYVYLAVYPTPETKKVNHRNNLLLRPGAFTTPLFHFSSLHIRKTFSMKTLPDTHVRGGIELPVSRHHLADSALPTTGPALRPYTE